MHILGSDQGVSGVSFFAIPSPLPKYHFAYFQSYFLCFKNRYGIELCLIIRILYVAFMTKEEKEAVSLGKPNLKLKTINKCLILL
jgi:hypothetical protein